MIQGGGSGGMRKLPGKHNTPIMVSVPVDLTRLESPHHGKRRTSRVFGAGCLAAVTLMLVCVFLCYLAVYTVLYDWRQLVAADKPTAEDRYISKSMTETAAPREQKWRTSPPDTAHPITETHTPTILVASTASPTSTPGAPQSSQLSMMKPAAPTRDKDMSTTPHTDKKTDPDGQPSGTGLPDDTLPTITTTVDLRTVQPHITSVHTRQRDDGEYVPEEPHLLPGLQIQRRTFTPAELLERFGRTRTSSTAS
ncbi:hypothetical protein, unknown function [Leishmania tarentolae]|uniref:Uncharacterized protein n=1 Tax=Leishmania tarentolae TaxID=5689 RepID=A0A640KJ04_LEITA|nr:hypothetical protein, unknown function [Leishmania tarentolae]